MALRITFPVLLGLRREVGGNVVSPPPQQGQAPWLSPQSTCCTCTEAALAEEVMGEPLNTQLLGCLSPWRGEKTKLFPGPKVRPLTLSPRAASTAPGQPTQLRLNRKAEGFLQVQAGHPSPSGPVLSPSPPWVRQIP